LSSLTVEDSAHLINRAENISDHPESGDNSMRKAILPAIAVLVALLPSIGVAQEVSKGEWMCRYENGKFWLELRTESAKDK
jgi:hypothetical protein